MREDLLIGYLLIPNPVKEQVSEGVPEVAYRKHLVIRFFGNLGELDGHYDLAEIDKQSSLIWHLGERYPLVVVCRDGEEPEGLEAWFKVEGWTEEECRALMDEACKLGADPATFDPRCFVHLPGAINPGTGKVQKLIYMDPEGKNFPDGPTPLRERRPKGKR